MPTVFINSKHVKKRKKEREYYLEIRKHFKTAILDADNKFKQSPLYVLHVNIAGYNTKNL